MACNSSTIETYQDLLLNGSNVSDSGVPLAPAPLRISLAIIMMLMIVVGFLGNAVVCIIVYQRPAMRSAINLTSLLGHWTSLDRNFEIKEGGTVTSSLQSEKNPWTSWKIWNGKLILSKDTFDVDNLGADSLSLENKDGIFIYTREK